MGERHDAQHSVAQARQRVSEIAEELSRRANGDYVRARAKETLKERAKMKMRTTGYEAKDQLLDNPLLLGLVTGAVGVIAGKALKASRERRGWESSRDPYEGSWDRPYDEYTATHPPSGVGLITDDASLRGEVHQGVRGADLGGEEGTGHRFEEAREGIREKASEMRERASEVRQKASMKMSEVGDRTREVAHRVRERMPQLRDEARVRFREGAHSVRYKAEEHPGVWAAGAILAGAFFGALMPLSQRERRMLEPAKTRAQSGLETFKQEARGHMEGLKENARAAVTGMASELGLTDESRDRYSSGQSTGSSSWQQGPSGSGWKAEGETSGYGYGSDTQPGGWRSGGSQDDERGEGSASSYRDPDDLNRR